MVHLTPSLRIELRPLIVEELRPSEISTRPIIPHGSNYHQDRCENLKFRTVRILLAQVTCQHSIHFLQTYSPMHLNSEHL